MNMPNENRNKPPLWKNKLEALNGLPEDTFNKTAAWEKLYARLHARSSVRKVALHWAAAACIILMIFISFLLKEEKEISLVKNQSKQKSSIEKSSFSTLTDLKKDSVKTAAFISNKKKRAQNIIIKTNRTHISPKNNSIADTFFTENILQSQDTARVIIHENTSSGIVIKARPQKKFRVIHINELSQPAEEIKYARNEGNSFLIKISNKDIFSSSPENTNAGYHILKINLSPQN